MSEIKVIANMARCKLCKDEIWSKHVRDFVTCECGTVSIDGGISEYSWKYGGDNLENISIYSNEPYSKLRHYILRGSRGKYGNEPLKYITLAQMNDEHLLNTIKFMEDTDWVKFDHYEYLLKEINFRNLKTTD